MTNPINAQDLLELIEGYKSYESDCRQSDTLIDISRANLYKTIRHDLEALLPTPPRPTLADMAPEEREACQWMQANLDGSDTVTIISPDLDGSNARILTRHGYATMFPLKKITPRPDLPRMVWPSSGPEGVNGPFPDPEQPRVLSTLSDYENAPEGTIVHDYLGRTPGKPELLWQKLENMRWWKVGGDHHASMPGKIRTVLRWGWGERA